MDQSAGLGEVRDEGPGLTDRKGPPRQRAEPGNLASGSPGRPPQDNRRKRGSEQRYAGWRDGIERVYCARSKQLLPEVFPVASHAGTATMPAATVARRAETLLLCTFSHHGPHIWPDGELVDDGPAMVHATSETAEDPGRSQLQ